MLPQIVVVPDILHGVCQDQLVQVDEGRKHWYYFCRRFQYCFDYVMYTHHCMLFLTVTTTIWSFFAMMILVHDYERFKRRKHMAEK